MPPEMKVQSNVICLPQSSIKYWFVNPISVFIFNGKKCSLCQNSSISKKIWAKIQF